MGVRLEGTDKEFFKKLLEEPQTRSNSPKDYLGSSNEIHLSKIRTQFPRWTDNNYIELVGDAEKLPCTASFCQINTRVRVEGAPYCLTHTSLALIQIVVRLENRLLERDV